MSRFTRPPHTLPRRALAHIGTWALLFALASPMAQAATATLAIADSPPFSTALIAEAEGYFASEGLDLKIIHCINGKRCLKHLTDGEAQYATAADTPIVLAALAGAKFEILTTLGLSTRETRFVARTDKGIRSAADLRGKRIGFIKGTTTQYFVDTLLLQHGISAAQVKLVPIEVADAAAALGRGDIDAAGLYSPLWQQAQALLGTKLITLPSPTTFSVTAYLVSAPKAAGGRDADAIKLLRALRRADLLIDLNPPRARTIIAQRLHLVQAEVDALWGDYDFAMALGQPVIADLEVQTRWALREGLVPGATMPDYLDYVRRGPLRAVAPKSVTLVK